MIQVKNINITAVLIVNALVMSKKHYRRNILLLTVLFAGVIAFTSWIIYQIKLNEDLTLLQIDLMDTLIAAKKCLEEKNEIQDIYQAIEKGKSPENILVCKNKEITAAVYPDLKNLSAYHLDYDYLPADKCLAKTCSLSGPRLNIGRKGKVLLSCDLATGYCQAR